MPLDPLGVAQMVLLPVVVGALTGALAGLVTAPALLAGRPLVHPAEHLLGRRWAEPGEHGLLVVGVTVGSGAVVGGALLLSMGLVFWFSPPGSSLRWVAMGLPMVAFAAVFPAAALATGDPSGESRDAVTAAWAVLGLLHSVVVAVVGVPLLAVSYVAIFGFGFH